MLSIIVTTKDPLETFAKSFAALAESALEWKSRYPEEEIELLIVSPFAEQIEKILPLSALPRVFLKDPGKGKPLAINVALQKASGDIILFTDGDVLVDKTAVGNLYAYMISEGLSIAGGKPVSMNTKETMLGYWSWVLCEGNAHRLRTMYEEKRKEGQHQYFSVSGYLFIAKKSILEDLDPKTLSDDAYISYMAFKKGYDIGYCPKAVVYVKYPDTYQDYLKQKVRSTGGYKQGEIAKTKSRSFLYESIKGTLHTLSYARSPMQLLWSILLLFSRLHVWVLIFYILKIRKDENIWVPIASSKKI